MRRASFAAAIVLALTAGAAGDAAADWLVTRDGSRVETRGPWEVREAIVVFTLTNGSLGSLRVADVDLDASRAASAPPPPPPAPPPPRAPILVLTDADVAHVGPSGEGEAGAPQDAAAPGADAAAPDAAGEDATAGAVSAALTVTGWDDETLSGPEGGTAITGTLSNVSENTVAGIFLLVHLEDVAGGTLASSPAALGSAALSPGQETPFRAPFPGIFTFANARFEARGTGFAPTALGTDAGETAEPYDPGEAEPPAAEPEPDEPPLDEPPPA
jgi:hypothetical protein